jgi:aquaporin Z
VPGDHGSPGDETEAEAGRAPRGFDARALISLESPFGPRLDDPVVELRRLFAEFLGTAMLVLVAAGAPVVDTVVSGSVSASAQVVAPGLVVMAIVYGIGAVGGAHLNPAVTLSFAVRGNFPWVRVPGYVAMQLLGAVIAVAILRWLFGDVGGLGATVPADVVTDGRAVAVEALLTLGLVTVILGTATGAKNVGANAAIAIGGYVALAGLWAAPITGASMNPARSFGPMLVSGDWDHGWVYVVGPVLGGLVAVGCAWLLRGPPSRAADVAAQGVLEPPMRG